MRTSCYKAERTRISCHSYVGYFHTSEPSTISHSTTEPMPANVVVVLAVIPTRITFHTSEPPTISCSTTESTPTNLELVVVLVVIPTWITFHISEPTKIFL